MRPWRFNRQTVIQTNMVGLILIIVITIIYLTNLAFKSDQNYNHINWPNHDGKQIIFWWSSSGSPYQVPTSLLPIGIWPKRSARKRIKTKNICLYNLDESYYCFIIIFGVKPTSKKGEGFQFVFIYLFIFILVPR